MASKIEELKQELIHLHLHLSAVEAKANYYQGAFFILLAIMGLLIGYVWALEQLKVCWR